jgi:hypothetical protein
MASLEYPTWLSHACLVHVNFQALGAFVDKKMAAGVPLIRHLNLVCHIYLVAKQSRRSFLAMTQYRAKEPLELLHLNLCGPISPSTLVGNKYFMSIVDEYS